MSFGTSRITSLLLPGLVFHACVFDHARPNASAAPDSAKSPANDSNFVMNQDPYNQARVLFNDHSITMPILGSGYYIVSKNKLTYYSRDSVFQFNAYGQLQTLDGYTLMGVNADSAGNIIGNTLSEIIVHPYLRDASTASQSLSFRGNLDANSYPMGTISYSKPYFAIAEMSNSSPNSHDGTALVHLSNSKCEHLGLKAGDKITITDPVGNQTSFNITDDPTDPNLFAIAPYTTPRALYSIRDLIEQITSANPVLDAVMGLPTGQITIPKGWQVTTTSATAATKVANSFSGSLNFAGTSYTTDSFRRPATGTDLIADIFDQEGHNLYDPLSNTVANPNGNNGLQDGDPIKVFAFAGTRPQGGMQSLTFNHTTTTLRDIADLLRSDLGLPLKDITPQQNHSVSVNPTGSDDHIPDGSIVVRGLPSTDNALSQIRLSATNSDPTTTEATFFNSNSFTELQSARNPRIATASTTILDRTSGTHQITITATPTTAPWIWEWKASTAGNETINGGGSGKITFGNNGLVQLFSTTDNSPTMRIDPGNGSDIIDLSFDLGKDNQNGALSLLFGDSDFGIQSNGLAWGKPDSLLIDAGANIQVNFSNGKVKRHSQIRLADITAAQGLTKIREGLWQAPNSKTIGYIGNPSVSPARIKGKVVLPE